MEWQAVAAIASTIAAFVALFTAWLIYRARPLAVRAIELHSLKFQQELLPDWKNNLPWSLNISSYNLDKYSFSNSTLVQVETSALFQDLVNHLPAGNLLMLMWPKYHQDWENLDESRTTFARKVRDFIDQAARQIGLLGVGSENDRNSVIESHFVHWYYNAIMEFCQGHKGPYESLKEHASRLKLAGDNPPYRVEHPGVCWTFVSNKATARKAIKLFRKLVDELPRGKSTDESISAIEEARRLCEDHNSLTELRDQIQYEIEALIALPLLPNPSCPLMQIASPPLLPRWLMRVTNRFPHQESNSGGSNNEAESDLFNPLSLGILFFVFCLTLWGQGLRDTWTTVLGSVTLAISVSLGVAVLCKPFRNWLYDRRVYVWFLPLAFLGYLFAYIMTWLYSLPKFTGIIFHALFGIGFAWIFVLIMVEASIISRKHRLLGVVFSCVFFGLAVNMFLISEWIAGLILLVFGIGVLVRAVTNWGIWEKLSL